ncbi:hypothetical protein EG833_02220, partial [archaeon]|nr:hypothetical protein [archaeon]
IIPMSYSHITAEGWLVNGGRSMDNTRCIALYSGGLDSILAIRMMQEQSIHVIPLFFATPFFGFHALRDPDAFKQHHRQIYGIEAEPFDFTDDMIGIIGNPRHGFGKNINPCIDCKIGMLKKARSMLETLGASFIITGEVLGQRPMSQRRDTMNAIIKESGLRDILLRPLCAKLFPPTMPEREGLVDRDLLGEIAGRGRRQQMEMAAKFGIDPSHIPAPAGGCLLTYERTAYRVRQTFGRFRPGLPSCDDVMLDTVGRKFMPDENTVLVVSREEGENEKIAHMVCEGNIFIKLSEIPGPLCILRGNITEESLRFGAAVCLRYSRERGREGHTAMYGPDPEAFTGTVSVPVFTEEYCRRFQIDANIQHPI